MYMARIEWLRLLNLRLRWIAPALLLVAVLIAAPFLLTTQLARFILAREFPANHPALASAELSRSGKIVLRDLVLHDTGASSQKPLVSASEIDAAFEWRALLARKMRSIRIHELTVYARSNASSQLSLAQLLFEQLPSNANPAALPLWIDRLELSGTIRSEPIAGFTTAPSAWPLDFHMTMSGGRLEPSRRLSPAHPFHEHRSSNLPI
jgi:hypothetical protein